MKTLTKRFTTIIAILLLTGYVSMAQKATESGNSTTKNETVMKTYLIERDIPGVCFEMIDISKADLRKRNGTDSQGYSRRKA